VAALVLAVTTVVRAQPGVEREAGWRVQPRPLFSGPLLDVDRRPSHMVAADLNGDGLRDLLVANEVDSLTILHRSVDSGFDAGIEVPVSFDPERVCVEDLDGDGIVELIYCSKNADSVTVLTLEDGLYTEVVTVSTPVEPAELKAADFNLDGLPDILVSCVGGNSGWLLVNAGGLEFEPPRQVSVGGASIAVADFNGDGAPDYATIGSFLVAVMVNDGSGGFSYLSGSQVWGATHAVSAVDLNADGLEDVVVSTSAGISAALNQGGGILGEAQDVRASFRGDVIATLDLDGDGDADVVAGDTFRGTAMICVNDGNGTLSEPTFRELRATPVAFVASPLVSARINDLGVLCRDTAEVMILRRDGRGGLETFESGPSGTHGFSLVTADLDLDGDMDLVTDSSNAAKVLENDGRGGFSVASQLPSARGINSFAVEDVDGDGLPDLVTNSAHDDLVQVFLNGGALDLWNRFDLPAPTEAREVAASREAASQSCKIFATDWASVTVWSIGGAGGVEGPWRYAQGSGPGIPLATGDFNGDGRVDLATRTGLSSVGAMFGRGGVAFRIQPSVGVGVTVQDLAVADLDADGRDEIVVPLRENGVGVVRWGDGRFVVQKVGSGDFGAQEISVGDADGDGSPDILVITIGDADARQGRARIWLNDGHGNFRLGEIFSLGRDPASSLVVDVDNDGDGDAAVVGSGGSLVEITRAFGTRRR
jgi:hypothetical protein